MVSFLRCLSLLFVIMPVSLHYRVEIDGRSVVVDSPLGLEFRDGAKFGPMAAMTNAVDERSAKNIAGIRSSVQITDTRGASPSQFTNVKLHFYRP
jgi:hypothetical protein